MKYAVELTGVPNGISQSLYLMTSSVAMRGSLVVTPWDSRRASAITADCNC
jgi:hypothetical protein